MTRGWIMLLLPKEQILRDKKYVKSFAIEGEHSCLITGTLFPDGSHVRYGFNATGMKPPDNRIIPLAHPLHLEQHNIGELQFWILHFNELPLGMREDAIQIVLEETDLELTKGYISIMDIVIQIAKDYYDNYVQ